MNPPNGTARPPEPSAHAKRASLRLVGIYALFSFLWILFSDKAVGYIFRDPTQIVWVSTLKGWLFVAVTSLLLYVLARRLFAQIQSHVRRELDARSENARTHQLLATLVDSSSDAIFAKDLTGRYLLFNREAARLTGRAPEDIIDRDDTAIFPPEHVAHMQSSDRAAIADNRVATYEETVPTVDGERVFLTTKGPLREDSGEVMGVFGIARDITERTRAEEAVRKSEANFRSLFDDNTSVMLLMDRMTGDIVEANAAAIRFYGYPKESLLRMNIGEINTLPPEQIAQARERAIIGNRQVFYFPHRLASGEIRDVEVHTTPIQREGRALLLSIVHDITHRKQAEQSLRESEERLRLAMDASSQGWFDLDLVSGSISVSPEYVRMIGYEPGEFTSNIQSWLSSVHPDDRDTVSAAIKDCADNGGPCTLEYRRRAKSGQWLWIRSVGKVVEWNSAGRAIRMIGIHTDITERKEMEDRIRQLAFFDPLTRLPNRRLLNDRLNQAMAASKRSGRYSALMFADLDNFKPLNDLHGHEVGDLLLIEVADRLKKCVREMDTVARFGGDEFVIMICELDTDKGESTEQARAVAEKIRVALAQPYVLTVDTGRSSTVKVEHECSASIGLTLFLNHESTQADILKEADIAMYAAKDAGRNMICFFTPKQSAAPYAGP
ncbi:MAG: PAS domain S-box protein [Propionivibrio sp.]|nr:PAS domain S-box protein [Propionivibrio sp.]